MGMGNSKARTTHGRALRIAALLLVGALVAWIAGGMWPWPWNYYGFLYEAPRGDFYPLWFAYVVFAVTIGDLWESAGAVACAAVVAGLLQLGRHGFYSPYYPVTVNVWGWLIFVLSSAALVAIVHRRRVGSARAVAFPVVSSDLEDPVLIIRGHAQLLQGTGVVFDTRQGHGGLQGQPATAELAGMRLAKRGGDDVE